MTWDFSTFRKASGQTLLIFYSFAVFLGIAAQLSNQVPATDMQMYLLSVVMIAVLVIYAHGFMGWSVPRPIFLLTTGVASLWAIAEFESDATKFALVCLAAFLVVGALLPALVVMERKLIALKGQKQKKGDPDDSR